MDPLFLILLCIAGLAGLGFLFWLGGYVLGAIQYALQRRSNRKRDPRTGRKALKRDTKYSTDDAPIPLHAMHTDDFYSRKKDKKQEEQRKRPTVERMTPAYEEEVRDDIQIVDIAKPVGKWTEFVTGQKMGYLRSVMTYFTQKTPDGFWVTMIKAQERSKGKYKGRDR